MLLASGGNHLTLQRESPSRVRVHLTQEPDCLHIPSVDVMMLSAVQTFGKRILGVILTGMGHDGLEGMAAIHAAGGTTLAQDEDFCVVYGMPRA